MKLQFCNILKVIKKKKASGKKSSDIYVGKNSEHILVLQFRGEKGEKISNLPFILIN